MRAIEKRLERLEQAAKAARRVVRRFVDFYPTFQNKGAEEIFYSSAVPPAAPHGLADDDLEKYETGRKLRAALDKFYTNSEVEHA